MKHKINVVLVILLAVAGIAIAGLIIDNKTTAGQLEQKDEKILELLNSSADTNKRLYDVTVAKNTSNTTSKVNNVNYEEECSKQAERYSQTFSKDSSIYTTYTSHWNRALNACIMDLVIKDVKSSTVLAIANMNLTNHKVINNCITEKARSVEELGCDSNVFIIKRESLMTQ